MMVLVQVTAGLMVETCMIGLISLQMILLVQNKPSLAVVLIWLEVTWTGGLEMQTRHMSMQLPILREL